VVGLCLLAPGSALAGPAESFHSLNNVEATFYRVGLRFKGEWRPNPYLKSDLDPRSALPGSLRRHLVGVAVGANSSTFQSWSAYVFDGSSAATTWEGVLRRTSKRPQSNGIMLRAGNVVYFGSRLPRALRAMARLRHQ